MRDLNSVWPPSEIRGIPPVCLNASLRRVSTFQVILSQPRPPQKRGSRQSPIWRKSSAKMIPVAPTKSLWNQSGLRTADSITNLLPGRKCAARPSIYYRSPTSPTTGGDLYGEILRNPASGQRRQNEPPGFRRRGRIDSQRFGYSAQNMWPFVRWAHSFKQIHHLSGPFNPRFRFSPSDI